MPCVMETTPAVKPLDRLLQIWLIPLIAINMMVIGYLAFAGVTLLPKCGAWRWFGVWQIGAAVLLAACLYFSFRLKAKRPGFAAAILLIAPFVSGSSLDVLIDVMAWLA